MIALQELAFGYRHQPPLATLSGCFHQGSLTAIIGANGSGKSTLLKTLVGLLPPLSGSFSLGNDSNNNAIGYLPQLSEFDRQFPISVRDLVLMGSLPHRGLLRGINTNWHRKAIDALDAVSMTDFADRHIGVLSGGQLQRVLFARLLLTQAPIILLDEPFTGVDSQTTQALLQIIEQLHAEGRTILAVLHDLELVGQHFPNILHLTPDGHRWGDAHPILHSLRKADSDTPTLRIVTS
ncbi:metal ABC transporter ATP-binding protein [Pectobacterium carotovorum]|uniref:metal ABC transporter ATP-binding protein n=1 Tax=Pectobacterium carotovorum TaxID=554 RepID=UPI0005032680|nr:ABC transporter ATP-binding protein [Pectobacterium carotovorum]KFX01697.1 ABC transporter [Pectobacterium carotovorum subsp. carotovorum]KHT24286.1 ABC transporter [Pectobacterium carotovorum subsp. carotovorum]KML67007.1 ABC transporter [Pectobacterium carotovorum subsp. carotovorum ICMP 5702]MBA0193221.1 ABC transporter ATP-binding protein [Pectobacterium carotovorum]MBA0200171.1 ABC transporter ATP-binding protein [Pectobacterium carotovorum]